MQLRPYIKVVLAAILCTGGIVLADWDVGDPALHYQLPDSDGWSVYGDGGAVAPVQLADNWTATTTSPITGIYFWGGWNYDQIGSMVEINVQILSNDTSGAFDKPSTQLWEHTFSPGDYTSRYYSYISQGFYDTRSNDCDADNHNELFQYCLNEIPDPYTQQAGSTYWFVISTDVEGGLWGWNTAASSVGSSAVFWDDNNTQWVQLMESGGSIPMDMAFVLTPEPATILLLGLGTVMLRRVRK